MRLNSKGQVTIPAELRRKHGLAAGDEIDIVEDEDTLKIVHRSPAKSRGERIVQRMRGPALKRGPSTDELMELLRGT